jgi:hypothetical protein
LNEEVIKGNNEHTLPPLIEKHLELTIWMMYKLRKFNKDLRYLIGNNIADACLLLLDVLIEAYYGKKGQERIECIKKALLLTEQLRLKLRMTYVLGLMPTRSIFFATNCLQEQAKMLQGWLKTENAHV